MRTAVGQSVFLNKYAHEGCETWEKLSSVLVDEVCQDLLTKEEVSEITRLHSEMKFIAGGRYLYYAGRDMKFYNNCFSGDTKIITDKGLQKLKDIQNETVNLLSPVSGKFLPARINNHGKQKLRELTFKSVRGKSSLTYKIKATRNHHWVLMNGKDTYDLRLNDVVPANSFSCEEDKIGYLHGLIFGDGSLEYIVKKGEFKYVNKIRLCNEKRLLLDEVVDILKNNNINYTLSYPESYNKDPLIRIWYSYSFKDLPLDSYSSGYKAGFLRGWLSTDGSETAGCKLGSINEKHIDWFIENACLAGVVITGNKRHQTRDTEHKDNHTIFIINYCYGKKFSGFKLVDIKELEEEEDVFCPFEPVYNRIVIENNIDTFNCFLFKSSDDSREDWSDLSWKAQTCLMTGGGIGNDYSIYREKGAPIGRTGGTSSGPISPMHIVNEIGRNVIQGGSRRSALYASLNWKHPDAHEMLIVKDWKRQYVPGTGLTYKDVKEKDFNFPAPLDMTNISLNYDNRFLEEIHGNEAFDIYQDKKVVNKDLQLPSMFLNNVQKACENGEPGFSFNFYDKEKETARNACQPAFAKVLTRDGVKRFDQVDIGTEIWSVDGWTKIVKKWSTGIKKVYEVLFSDNRSKFIGTLNHKLVTGVDYKDDSFIKTELQDVILDRLPVKTFSYDSDSILMRDLENLIAGRFTEESHMKSHKLLGEYEVFDITVDNNSHTYWTEGVNVSNCTEVTSEDDSDVCNLASINMAEIETYEEFCLTVAMAYKFLFCGTLKADLPYDKVYQIREKNRRIGLGLMGIHEWLLKRGYRYEVTEELHKWLKAYQTITDNLAQEMSMRLSVSKPVANRAIAPTGSIGMLAGTTTGIEPLYAVAYKRRYLKEGHNWHYQYVVDGTAKMLINEYGLDPDKIETAIDLAADPERRIKFQADIQDYVDMSISSTINLPAWGSELNNESTYPQLAQILGRYAHRLRGFTCYPDGARGGQPLTSVSYHDAIQHEGNEYVEEFNDVCVLTGKGGTCGS